MGVGTDEPAGRQEQHGANLIDVEKLTAKWDAGAQRRTGS
jgi:hypothetical protein